jgi:antitoxin ParD1/3/4
VVLTEQQQSFIKNLVENGRYQNASEVLRNGLRLLEHRVQQRETELANTQARVIAGFDQVERGEFAKGSREEAIERAFSHAVRKAWPMRGYRLSSQAELTLKDIISWTIEHFGTGQAERYKDQLISRLAALTANGLPRGLSCNSLLTRQRDVVYLEFTEYSIE